MSSPYPQNVEHGTLDEELYNIAQVREALSRLERSSSFNAEFSIQQVQESLDTARDELKEERKSDALHRACQEAFLAYSTQEVLDEDEAADELLDIITGDSVSQKVSVADRIETHLPRKYSSEFSEDDLLDAFQSFLETPSEW